MSTPEFKNEFKCIFRLAQAGQKVTKYLKKKKTPTPNQNNDSNAGLSHGFILTQSLLAHHRIIKLPCESHAYLYFYCWSMFSFSVKANIMIVNLDSSLLTSHSYMSSHRHHGVQVLPRADVASGVSRRGISNEKRGRPFIVLDERGRSGFSPGDKRRRETGNPAGQIESVALLHIDAAGDHRCPPVCEGHSFHQQWPSGTTKHAITRLWRSY